MYDLARLLLLYHDPQLCNHIDSLKIGFQHFATSWFSSLMAQGGQSSSSESRTICYLILKPSPSPDCEVEVTSQLWDLYLVNQDPWIIFFMVTVMLVNFRENIMEVSGDRCLPPSTSLEDRL